MDTLERQLIQEFKAQQKISLLFLSKSKNASVVFGVLRELEYFAEMEREAEAHEHDVPAHFWSMSI